MKGHQMRRKSRFDNEEGAVLVIALMMLILLTILGVSISTTSEVELQIAGNERRYKENLYLAEAAAMECLQTLDEDTDLQLDDYTWLYDIDEVTADDVRDDAAGPWAGTDSQVSSADDHSRFLAVFAGVPHEGVSGLGVEESKVYEYTIYGRTIGAGGGRSIVRLGYLRPGDEQ
jgi:hypothetical protein